MRKIKIYTSLAIFIFLVNSSAQSQTSNVAGTWQGIATQPTGLSLASNYPFWVEIKQKGDSVSGFSRMEVANTANFGIIEFKGIVKKDSVILNETKIWQENLILNGSYWCIKKMAMVYNKAEGTLSGTWIAPNGCGPGEMFFLKTDDKMSMTKAQSEKYSSLEELKKSIAAKKNIADTKVVISNITFEKDKKDLNTKTAPAIDEIVTILKNNPALKIKILGHTDSDGKDAHNFKLSAARAKSVKDLIVSKGINAARVSYLGFGESRPLGDNATAEGREKNRRIEFEVQAQ